MNNQLVIDRELDAPRSRVWKAWTDPEMMKKWWGPKGFTAPVAEIDLRLGGKYFSCMRSPEGKDFCGTGEYLEIVPEEKLVVSDSFADEKGNPVSARYYGMSDGWPMEMKMSVRFEDRGGKTMMHLMYPDLSGVDQKDMEDMKKGWSESLDKLEESLK